jgi:hypothetical protein
VTPQPALLPTRRSVRGCDVAVAIYALVCLTLGVVVGMHVWALAELHRGLLEAADALDLTARAIALLGDVPFVGPSANELAGSVTDTSTQVRASALDARADVRVLAVLVGTAVGVLPVVPMLAVYVPLRIAWRRAVHGRA